MRVGSSSTTLETFSCVCRRVDKGGAGTAAAGRGFVLKIFDSFLTENLTPLAHRHEQRDCADEPIRVGNENRKPVVFGLKFEKKKDWCVFWHQKKSPRKTNHQNSSQIL